MKISILCSSHLHPVFAQLAAWSAKHSAQHQVELVERKEALHMSGGDILFLISCTELIPRHIRERYRAALVIHASDLPLGRGWSPMIWQLLEGKNSIPVTLLEVADPVDSGCIWKKTMLHFEGHELYDELNAALFEAELELMDFAIANLDTVLPTPQQGSATYYRRRTADDSRLDVTRSLADQFDLLRVADPERYPAFFDYKGHRYQLTIKKADEQGH
jgi:methionyl-tRNA formyltransferase